MDTLRVRDFAPVLGRSPAEIARSISELRGDVEQRQLAVAERVEVGDLPSGVIKQMRSWASAIGAQTETMDVHRLEGECAKLKEEGRANDEVIAELREDLAAGEQAAADAKKKHSQELATIQDELDKVEGRLTEALNKFTTVSKAVEKSEGEQRAARDRELGEIRAISDTSKSTR